jgi:serine/threonine protein kinase/tetratricopeptide (TPR) repeat protein/TolB-like protein
MICVKCGAENDGNNPFCRHCHARLAFGPGMGANAAAAASPDPGKDREGFPETLIHGRFKLIRVLGHGGMGEIYLAEDNILQRKVAIKSIGCDSVRDNESKARFQREARAASQLDHPNICTIYEIAVEDDGEYIIMQYVDGVPLDQLLKMKPLSLGQVIDIALQLSDGMIQAHEQDIVHRDLKPGNIMIDRHGKVKILDFGLAKFCPGKKACTDKNRTEADLTEKGVVMGTVAYMSPEQAKGLEIDGGSDIFSFGVVLYEMLEKKNPFADKENIVTLYNILNKPVKLSPNVPAEIKKIVYQALQKDRAQRQKDFHEIRRDLTAFRDTLARKKTSQMKPITEVIASVGPESAQRDAGYRARSSGDENLSELVRRLKRQKASTEKMHSEKSRRTGVRLAVLVPLLFLAAFGLFRAAKAMFGPGGGREASVTILVHDVKNQSSDPEVGAMVNHLIVESLSQFQDLRVIDEKTLAAFSSRGPGQPGRPARLKKKPAISYTLKTELSNVGDKFNIEADFSPRDGGDGHTPFFIPGKEKNSLLSDQVDNLTRRIRQIVFSEGQENGPQFFRLASMYGADWQHFTVFFRGLRRWNKKQFASAQEFLQQASVPAGPPLASYYLALLADYTGNGAQAREHIHEIVPRISGFSRPWQLKILALQAKFDFNSHEQIARLQELKGYFPFHKEVSYEVGEAHFAFGNAAQAMPEFLEALAMDRNYPDALNHLGYCYSYLGDHTRAIECFEKYRSIDRSANSFDSLGDGYFFKGDYIQAENNKVYATSLDGSMNWAYLTIADIHILKANDSEAERYLDAYQLTATFPKARADAIAKRSFIRFRNFDYIGALKLLDEAIRIHDSTRISDTSGEYHWLKGLCAIALRDLDSAKKEWRWLQDCTETYRLSPVNFHANYKYAMHLQALLSEKEGLTDLSGRIFREMLSMKTQLSYWITQYHYQFFQTEYIKFLLRQKDLEAAAAAIRECLEFNPDYPPALWVQYSLYKQTGNPDSVAVLRKIASIYGPGDRRSLWRRRLAIESRKSGIS